MQRVAFFLLLLLSFVHNTSWSPTSTKFSQRYRRTLHIFHYTTNNSSLIVNLNPQDDSEFTVNTTIFDAILACYLLPLDSLALAKVEQKVQIARREKQPKREKNSWCRNGTSSFSMASSNYPIRPMVVYFSSALFRTHAKRLLVDLRLLSFSLE